MLILLPASLDARTDAAAEKPAVDPANAYGGNVLSLTCKLHIVLGLAIQSEANGEECSQGAGTWHGGHHQKPCPESHPQVVFAAHQSLVLMKESSGLSGCG